MIVTLTGLAATKVAVPALAQSAPAAATFSVLFDNTKAETAGNADWIVSTAMPDPTTQNPTPSTESSWTGAISAWGVALQRTGRYTLQSLSAGGRISYGDASNPQDLSTVKEFVLPEPNVLFTATEKTAIMTFVQNGGGLFMISDHNGSDRNNDGADSVKVLNDLMTNNTVDARDPFGFSIDVANIGTENPNGIGASAAGDAIIKGPFGPVTGTIIRSGTTATLHRADNAAAKGEIFRSSSSTSGTTGVAFASSTFGSGRVTFWGDSSPMDDGTGQPGNNLFNGWADPAGTNAALALNATEWLAGGMGTGGSGGSERVTNGGFESAMSGWTTSGGAIATTARARSGSQSAALCAANNCTAKLSQQVAIPAGTAATLRFQTYITTQETGGTAFDKLTVTASGSTVASASNVSAKGAWFVTTASLSAFAGQTITLMFTATNGTKLPTSFWVDDISVLA
ncbi:MAG: hydrolase [Pseudonocardiales bacterium]|nr:MAG: hydrolase [Pseudonocardiales bacterium]